MIHHCISTSRFEITVSEPRPGSLVVSVRDPGRPEVVANIAHLDEESGMGCTLTEADVSYLLTLRGGHDVPRVAVYKDKQLVQSHVLDNAKFLQEVAKFAEQRLEEARVELQEGEHEHDHQPVADHPSSLADAADHDDHDDHDDHNHPSTLAGQDESGLNDGDHA